jgi:hypothetical protein
MISRRIGLGNPAIAGAGIAKHPKRYAVAGHFFAHSILIELLINLFRPQAVYQGDKRASSANLAVCWRKKYASATQAIKLFPNLV